MAKGDLLYEGKGKRVYRTEDPETLVLEFKDTATAFDGKKREELDEKGRINNHINAFLMEKLASAGIPVHHRQHAAHAAAVGGKLVIQLTQDAAHMLSAIDKRNPIAVFRQVQGRPDAADTCADYKCFPDFRVHDPSSGFN